MQHALPFLDPERRLGMLQAAAALAARVGTRSPARAACLRFQAHWLSRPEVFYADPLTGVALVDYAEAARWLMVGC